jgi:hypothetical protein
MHKPAPSVSRLIIINHVLTPDDCGNEQFANSRRRPRVTRGAPNDYDSTAALPAGVTESQPPRFKLPILVG